MFQLPCLGSVTLSRRLTIAGDSNVRSALTYDDGEATFLNLLPRI